MHNTKTAVSGLILIALMILPVAGCPDIDLPQINPGNRPPTADAGPETTVCVGSDVTLSAAGSGDSDGDSLTYQWTQTNGPGVSLQNAGAVAASFTASGSGIYEYSVTVRDGRGGSDTDAVRVIVDQCGDGGGNGRGVTVTDSITVTYPSASTVWTHGVSTHVNFNGASGSEVIMEIHKGGAFLADYHPWTANDGHTDGQAIPSSWGTGADYKIKVIDRQGGFGFSAAFEIRSGG